MKLNAIQVRCCRQRVNGFQLECCGIVQRAIHGSIRHLGAPSQYHQAEVRLLIERPEGHESHLPWNLVESVKDDGNLASRKHGGSLPAPELAGEQRICLLQPDYKPVMNALLARPTFPGIRIEVPVACRLAGQMRWQGRVSGRYGR